MLHEVVGSRKNSYTRVAHRQNLFGLLGLLPSAKHIYHPRALSGEYKTLDPSLFYLR